MKVVSIVKGGLFTYESVRVIFLMFCLAYVVPVTNTVSWLAFAVPAALFPLMAIFICIDINRYSAYIPLYITGKCIGIFSLILFSVIIGRSAEIDKESGITLFIGLLFLAGDLLALAGILYTSNNFNNMTKLNMTVFNENETPDTEDIQ